MPPAHSDSSRLLDTLRRNLTARLAAVETLLAVDPPSDDQWLVQVGEGLYLGSGDDGSIRSAPVPVHAATPMSQNKAIVVVGILGGRAGSAFPRKQPRRLAMEADRDQLRALLARSAS